MRKLACAFCAILVCARAIADNSAEASSDADASLETATSARDGPEQVNLRGQFTYVMQYHPAFASPYGSANSLYAGGSAKETADLTLFAGTRLWRDAELYVNPEIDQGVGLSNTLGVAGFPSGEAYKVGATTPYLRVPRLFIRQVVDLGGATESVESQANQLSGTRTHDNLVLTVGKFSVVDIFDTNAYAH